jgi:ATP-binding cassette subfamily B protein
MNIELESLTWPVEREMEAFETVVVNSGLPISEGAMPEKPTYVTPEKGWKWIAAASSAYNIKVQEVTVNGNELQSFVLNGGPGYLTFAPDEAFFGPAGRTLVLARRAGRHVFVHAPDGTLRRLEAESLTAAILEYVFPNKGDVSRIFPDQPSLAHRLTALLTEEEKEQTIVGYGSVLGTSATRSWRDQARREGLSKHGFIVLFAMLAWYACNLLAWLSLSTVGLTGIIDPGRVTAWGILLVATTPFELMLGWGLGYLSIKVSLLLRRRLLEGTFRAATDLIRASGIGTGVALVMEPEVLEDVIQAQGVATFGTLLDFVTACAVIAAGPLALVQGAIYLVIWTIALWQGRRLLAATKNVVRLRSQSTGALVDQLVGHRTRTVQQPQERWHESEDEVLSEYVSANQILDTHRLRLETLPRTWLTLGAATVLFTFIASPSTSTSLIGLIAVVLGQQALNGFSTLMPDVALFNASYAQLRPVIDAGFVSDPKVESSLAVTAFDEAGPLIHAIDVGYEHRLGGRKILQSVELTIHRGDRILLEGPSGGGKSTLASILAGVRRPSSGTLLVSGLDQHTLDRSTWQTVVASVPQFHENHIFAETLAFNLLAGVTWPPSRASLREAMEVCRELGLGPVIERMPNGIHQSVGSTGWQLSQGELSRVFIARAILQNASLLILDESLGALDPETLQIVTDCVRRRARTLLVIAQR